MKVQLLGTFALLTVGMIACKKDDKTTTVVYPDMAEAVNPSVLFTTAGGVKVYNGGFGSAVAVDLKSPDVFYMLTDRGSNVAGKVANSIIIGKPDFTPQIGKFRLKDGKLILEQTIFLKNAAGVNLTGVP